MGTVVMDDDTVSGTEVRNGIVSDGGRDMGGAAVDVTWPSSTEPTVGVPPAVVAFGVKVVETVGVEVRTPV
ncbi:hypothetical protein DSECCO2_388520 [anaerobic digester metagenome]